MSAPNSPAAKTERLLNLVLCLLYTRTALPKSRIRAIVPQYAAAAGDEAFDRMFERDKDELRELGIPLVTEELSSIWEDEAGYRIDRRDYALPEITFEPDELAVLGLASRAWAQASLAGPAAEALRKLEASDVERDAASLIGIEPRLRTAEPAFDAVKDAVMRHQPITFDYRRGSETMTRHVQPWGLASWHGRWYLTGHDLDRDAERVFRLSRITGPVRSHGEADSYAVPAEHRPTDSIERAFPAETPRPASLRVRRGAGHLLRRRATSVADVDPVWSQLKVEFTQVHRFAEELASYGADVVVEEPPELLDAVRTCLTGALTAHSGPDPAPTGGGR